MHGAEHGHHGHDHSHADVVEALAGCDALLCRGMGWRAAEALKAGGVRPVVFTDEMSPEEAVTAYLAGSRDFGGTFCRCHE